ncbi:MAG: response regulator [Dermatophilaceae bacterium]
MISEPEVHEALENLSNSVQLAQCAIVSAFPQLRSIAALNERARSLRALLLEAIEALGPHRPLPFGSVESRTYDVLTLHYIERMSVVTMAEELSLSRRQVHRDLREAEGQLTTLLASWVGQPASEAVVLGGNDALSEELAVFSSRPAEMRLGAVLRDALAVVEGLAKTRGVEVRQGSEGVDAVVVTDRAFLSQLLAQTLSLAVQSCGGSVTVLLREQADSGEVVLQFECAAAAGLVPRLESLSRMAAASTIACRYTASDGAPVEVVLAVRRGSPVRLLVIEDNPGAIELYRRYLASGNWHVTGLSDPRGAHDLVRSSHPDVVVLDVMMPHVDGWTVLRMLKQHPDTAGVPVIVCSIVEDPALALALGAEAYLAKPVSQAELITSLHRCLGRVPHHWPG